MTREQAEKKIAQLSLQIAEVIEQYYPQDGYFHLAMDLRDGFIHFNNSDWEHAVGKINRVLIRKGGKWSGEEFITGDSDVSGEA